MITAAPQSAEFGTSINVEVHIPGVYLAADEIHRVTMLRLGSVTHQFDQDQRFIELDFDVVGPKGLSVHMPADGVQIVPGYTMLFVLTDRDVPQKFLDVASATGAPNPGVPSKGHYLRLDL